MLRQVDTMIGHRIRTAEGPMGEVEDFFFDDVDWRIRYLVANTSKWFGHEVLISPESFESVDWENGHIHVTMTKEQVEHAPPIAEHRPISRRFETDYRGFFGWPMYWVPYGIGDAVVHNSQMPPNTALPVSGTDDKGRSDEETPKEQEDAHLWSMRDLDSFEIRALDGTIGHVDDFFIDDTNLAVRYIVVNTRSWLPGKDIPINRYQIKALEWENRAISVKLTRHQIKNAPEYRGGVPTAEYEQQLQDYFSRTISTYSDR